MKKEDLIALGLDEETAQKVADASAEELKGFIPKQRFDDVNTAKKQLEQDIKDRDTQLEGLGKQVGDNEALKQQLDLLKEENQKKTAEYEAQLKKQTFDFSLDRALLDAKAKNLKAVKALLNTEAITLDNENLIGLSDQLTALRESDSYLFGEVDNLQGQPPKPSGYNPGSFQSGNNPKPKDAYEAGRQKALERHKKEE